MESLLRLWNAATGKEERRLEERHTRRVVRVALSPDGGQDGTARLWDVAGGPQVRSFEGHAG